MMSGVFHRGDAEENLHKKGLFFAPLRLCGEKMLGTEVGVVKTMSQILCITCSVFRPELTVLQQQGHLDFPIRYLDSNLHMVPAALHERMSALLEYERKRGRRVLLLYGDCHAYMADVGASPNVVRVQGANCCEILLGRTHYKQLFKERAFYLFPEWALRWQEILGRLSDLDEQSTVELLRDMHAKLIYLDTGALPVPEKELQACSEYFGLPCEVLRVSLHHFLTGIHNAVNALENRSNSA